MERGLVLVVVGKWRMLMRCVVPVLCLFLAACTHPTPVTQEVTSDQTAAAYDRFQQLIRDIPVSFRPEGFELFNYYPGNAVYFGFDRELAWGKRNKTIVDGDDSKPSQSEFLYLEPTTHIVSVVEIMFVPTSLEPDVIGFVSVPEQEAKSSSGALVRVRPPQDWIEIFSYGHAVIVIQTFDNNVDSKHDPLTVINTHKKLSLQLRKFLDERHSDLSERSKTK